MLFFQGFLLAGYALAHLGSSRLSPRRYAFVHLGLLAGALLFLPVAPKPETWKPTTAEAPTLKIFLLLAANAGVPYVVLASTSPLFQRWFNLVYPERSPYRLYALSNLGSLLGLLVFPFVLEPHLTLQRQVGLWSLAFGAFAFLSALCAYEVLKSPVRDQPPGTLEGGNPHDPRRPGLVRIAGWLFLPACGSAALLATTNQLCLEVAAVPFLWVLPLALYLLTFILTFQSEKLYIRWLFAPLMFASFPLAYHALREGADLSLLLQIVIYCTVLFLVCMVCHGELVRLKPDPKRLTGFYLAVALGGALGGAFAAVAAPRLFTDFYELHTVIGAAAVLGCLCWIGDTGWLRNMALARTAVLLPAFIATAVTVVAFVRLAQGKDSDNSTDAKVVYQARNFYGVLKVTEAGEGPFAYRSLYHGRILHGDQYLGKSERLKPTTYYGPESGVGLALTYHPKRFNPDPRARALKVGVIGLGTGTIAAYGKSGDVFRFYEINPEVERIARRFFYYLEDSKAVVQVVFGDARVSLERELSEGEAQHFDVLAVDAFSSDSIPVHLLTVECGRIYKAHLAPGGLLLLHISNRFLNLNPVTRGLAEELGLKAALIDSEEDSEEGVDAASWVIVTDNEAFLNRREIKEAITPWPEDDPPPLRWTDSFASLWQVVDW